MQITTNEDIITNLELIRNRVISACKKSNRNSEDVQVLLATKTVPATRIKVALRSGSTLIAENKIQELKEKYDALTDTPHTNHFIGHLQSNKIKDLLKYNVTCIQSIDRITLAQKLDSRLRYERKTMDVLIQVNTSAETSKFGVDPDEAINFVKQVATLDTIRIKGLMTIGLFSNNAQAVRACFRRLRAVQQEIIHQNIPGVAMRELSMGMSGDMEIAIEEGATIVRVGTAVFGKRPYPDSYYWPEQTIETV